MHGFYHPAHAVRLVGCEGCGRRRPREDRRRHASTPGAHPGGFVQGPAPGGGISGHGTPGPGPGQPERERQPGVARLRPGCGGPADLRPERLALRPHRRLHRQPAHPWRGALDGGLHRAGQHGRGGAGRPAVHARRWHRQGKAAGFPRCRPWPGRHRGARLQRHHRRQRPAGGGQPVLGREPGRHLDHLVDGRRAGHPDRHRPVGGPARGQGRRLAPRPRVGHAVQRPHARAGADGGGPDPALPARGTDAAGLGLRAGHLPAVSRHPAGRPPLRPGGGPSGGAGGGYGLCAGHDRRYRPVHGCHPERKPAEHAGHAGNVRPDRHRLFRHSPAVGALGIRCLPGGLPGGRRRLPGPDGHRPFPR
ncbi:hypothetical protein AZA_68113 [Nitrospirillum viridazoti Y2]|nr:hypothetical protein AZA_68113 [Nitrospirillum amazonense Y2]